MDNQLSYYYYSGASSTLVWSIWRRNTISFTSISSRINQFWNFIYSLKEIKNDLFWIKKIVKENSDVSKKIYICNFLTRKDEKMKTTSISIVKNIFCEYVVTLWIDYEYFKFEKEQTFDDKDSAANYAWQLYKHLKN